MTPVPVYLEVGKKKVLAGAVEWPGWARHGKDEESALQALFLSSPRYARILSRGEFVFTPPASPDDLLVTERLQGNASTDFGGFGAVPSWDLQPMTPEALSWFNKLLRACWDEMDEAVEAAADIPLRTGPRGGGRDIAQIVRHVRESEASYVGRMGTRMPKDKGLDPSEDVERSRQFILETLGSRAFITTPGQGPRGGKLWMPRYFVRTLAWHIIDHIWEIEDRS
jgi:hypothetical protein